MNEISRRFKGFENTPFLWQDELMNLHQFNDVNSNLVIHKRIDGKVRLGNYVESLVSYKFSNIANIQLLKENVQIIDHKTTVGEIDCLLMKDEIPIHLEIAYKFYLYDSSVGTSFLDHWIGPNRRDSLLLKLNKIKNKQFPLLYSKHCTNLLKDLNLDIHKIQQQSYFKAQLFIPFKSDVLFPELNPNCVQGYYISYEEMNHFKNCKFYIPRKLDWLIEPHTQVDWLKFGLAQQRIQEFHERKSAPLCWMKKPNGEIDKLFVVWWE